MKISHSMKLDHPNSRENWGREWQRVMTNGADNIIYLTTLFNMLLCAYKPCTCCLLLAQVLSKVQMSRRIGRCGPNLQILSQVTTNTGILLMCLAIIIVADFRSDFVKLNVQSVCTYVSLSWSERSQRLLQTEFSPTL